MDWSSETVLSFPDYYKEEPVIWNASHPNHKNRNDVHDAWKRIQQHIDAVYAVDELKKKKDSLMASFRMNLDKVKASNNSGASVDTVYKPNWFAYDRMATFLRDKDEPRATINSEVNRYQLQDNSSYSMDQADNTLEIENGEVILPSTSKKQESNPRKKRKQAIVEAHDIKKKMDNVYSVLQASFHKPAPQKDICGIYGELVSAKLRKMDEWSRLICMDRMDLIMFEMLNPTSVLNHSSAFPTTSNQQMTMVTSPASSVQSHSSYQQRLQPSPVPSQSPLSQAITPAPSSNDDISTYNSYDVITNPSELVTSSANSVQPHVLYQQRSQPPITSQSPLSQPIIPAPSPNSNVLAYNSPDVIRNQTSQNILNDNPVSNHVVADEPLFRRL